MIILDTDVLAETMRPAPNRNVLAWMDSQPPQSFWITSVTLFEVEFGLALLPRGRRRTQLHEAFTAMVAEDLDGRVLPFDDEAARRSAEMAAKGQLSGRSVEIRDVQIAGIAASRRATLATRNTRHFDTLGLRLVDPWTT